MEFVLHLSACRHDARFEPSDETAHFKTEPIGLCHQHSTITPRKASSGHKGQLRVVDSNCNASLPDRGKLRRSGKSCCGAPNIRIALENTPDKLLLCETSEWLCEPILGVVPRIQKAQFRKVNNDCVLGYGVGRMPAQDKAKHPDRSATRLNHKSSQRNFENPRKLLNTGLDVHPRSLQAHRFDLHFANRPTAIPGRKYQENAICKALKILQLNDNLDYTEQKNASYPFLFPNFRARSARRKPAAARRLRYVVGFEDRFLPIAQLSPRPMMR